MPTQEAIQKLSRHRCCDGRSTCWLLCHVRRIDCDPYDSNLVPAGVAGEVLPYSCGVGKRSMTAAMQILTGNGNFPHECLGVWRVALRKPSTNIRTNCWPARRRSTGRKHLKTIAVPASGGCRIWAYRIPVLRRASTTYGSLYFDGKCYALGEGVETLR